MNAFHSYLNGLVNTHEAQFSQFEGINWVNPYAAYELLEKRNFCLKNSAHVFAFKETKPFYKSLSPGCKLCGEGTWSCLFITGRCNANCFYCPSPQNSDDLPTSQGLIFPTAAAYAEYVNHFKFRGVSFSGGEPLLAAEKVLEYLTEIRRICSSEIYTWMYTNGMLANRETFTKLAHAGLNEVRFDIGATGYSLEKITYAKDIIPHITIEIPAVPEELEKLKLLLPAMVKAGVKNLNLHQLRLTPHNAPRLLKRQYTYIAAEKPIVLESEIAALEIIDYAHQNQLDIGINYCSFFFKNRFQSAGFRKQLAMAMPGESAITEKGYLRSFNGSQLSYARLKLTDENVSSPCSDCLALKHKTYKLKKETMFSYKTDSVEESQLIDNLITKEPEEIPSQDILHKIWTYEYIERGLRDL